MNQSNPADILRSTVRSTLVSRRLAETSLRQNNSALSGTSNTLNTMITNSKWAARKTAMAQALAIFIMIFALPGLGAPWVQTTSLPDTYVEHSLVYASGHLYQTGGSSGSGGLAAGTNVFYAQVHSDGTVGSWNSTTPLPESAFSHAGVAANGYVYVLGGSTFSQATGLRIATNIVYYAKINSDGSLGLWQTASPLPNNLNGLSASAWDNRIYVIGGSDGNHLTNTVSSATIQTDGSLSVWTTQAPLPVAIYAQAEAANGDLYVLGGINNGNIVTNTVFCSKINADGTLAGWNLTTPLPQPECYFGAVAKDGLVFSIGGYDSAPTSNSYCAAVNGDGSLTPWSSAASLPQPLYFHAVASSASYIFVSGGDNTVTASSAVYSMALPPSPVPPVFVSNTFTNGNFQLQLTSSTNTGFGLLASTNLVNWVHIGFGFTGTNGQLLFQDTNAASFPDRFYRAYWPLP